MTASPNYQKLLDGALAETGVIGASFAYWDGDRLHTAVSGVRNSATGDPVTVDTVMHLGSITKVLNTVLLMQLVDEGKVGLDDLVIKYLPELSLGDMSALKKITCGMLIDHTNGIDGASPADQGPDQERIVDAIGRLAGLGQIHAPGEATCYSNVGTVIAGYLTQKLRGVSWYTLVKTRIFEPLEMRHAVADFADLPKFRCSIGDLADFHTGKMNQTTRPFLPASFAPAGHTLMMSATDLVTFGRAMLNGGVGPNGVRILSAQSAAHMAKPRSAFAIPDWQMGLGWMIMPGGVLQHGGGGPGVVSWLYAHPDSGRVLALLRNCDRGSALDPLIVDPILESWTGIKKTRRSQSDPVDLTPYIGLYENAINRFEVFARDGRLTLQLHPKLDTYDSYTSKGPLPPPLTFQSIGDHTFEASILPQTPPYEFRFIQSDSNGRMKFLAFLCCLIPRVQ